MIVSPDLALALQATELPPGAQEGRVGAVPREGPPVELHQVRRRNPEAPEALRVHAVGLAVPGVVGHVLGEEARRGAARALPRPARAELAEEALGGAVDVRRVEGREAGARVLQERAHGGLAAGRPLEELPGASYYGIA